MGKVKIFFNHLLHLFLDFQKQLAGCEFLPIVAFKRIEHHILHNEQNILSKAKRHLHNIHVSIAAGSCSSGLVIRDPGPIPHSR